MFARPALLSMTAPGARGREEADAVVREARLADLLQENCLHS
jgi:hypothetical protein